MSHRVAAVIAMSSCCLLATGVVVAKPSGATDDADASAASFVEAKLGITSLYEVDETDLPLPLQITTPCDNHSGVTSAWGFSTNINGITQYHEVWLCNDGTKFEFAWSAE